jgi:ribose transport system permease protein
VAYFQNAAGGRIRKMNISNSLKTHKSFSFILNPVFVVFLLCLLLLTAGQMVSPGFASKEQIINMLVVTSFLGIVAAGQNLVVMGGKSGIDLSVGNLVTFGAIVGGAMMNEQSGLMIPAIIAVLLFSFLIGALNGVGIVYFRIPSLVMTLSMGIIVAAMNKFITGGVPVGGSSPLLKTLVVGRIAGIPGILIFWILIAIGTIILLRNTKFGMNLFAMGTNENAAVLSGIRVNRMRIVTYGLCSLLAGLAGFLYLGYLGSVYNITLGDKYTLPSVVAVVIGGTALSGGTGGYLGVVFGAILLQLLESVLITIRMEQFGRSIVFGIVLLLLIFVYGRDKKLRQ